MQIKVSKYTIFGTQHFTLLDNMICIRFVGIIPGKPSWDFICPLGSPRGLKGFLHMLNAIVFPMTEEVD
jgi:hypothetical protein